MMKNHCIASLVLLAIASGSTLAQEATSAKTKTIPATRSELKEVLGQLKDRVPRLPVPETVPGATNPASSNVINGRARRFYLPESWLQAERWGNEAESKVSYELKTQCFWVVSRGNNCHYCLGHQEHKLKLAGLSDDQIGALDRNWDSLDPRTRKGVELARKMTVLPFALSDRDVATLKSEYSDAEIVELVYSIARFNSMNRWTDSMGLPQDPQMRGESVEFATRRARVQLVSQDSAAEILQIPVDEVHDWHRAIATLPAAGPEMVRAWTAMLSDTELAPEIKAAICWTTARHNRAPSSLAMAKAFADRLKLTEQQIQAWDASDVENSMPGLVQAIEFAKKLTCDPTKISDADIARLREVFSDRQTAHAIYTAATANAMDRFTETLGLAIRP